MDRHSMRGPFLMFASVVAIILAGFIWAAWNV